MAAETTEDITGLLAAWSDGDQEALGHLVSVVYPEIRRIGRRYLRRSAPDETLESAAVANEAYLKLIRARGIRCPLGPISLLCMRAPRFFLRAVI